MYKEPETFWEKVADFYKYNRRRLFWLFILVSICIVGIVGTKVVNVAGHNYQLNKRINSSVEEVSRLIQNVRTLYNVYGEDTTDITSKLVSSGAISSSAVAGSHIKNTLGGYTLIVRNSDMSDSPEKPSFLLSYQGMTQEECIKLSSLDWGDVTKGFMAIAVGYVDENGNDSAMFDIDEKPNKIVAVKDAAGHVRYVEEKRKKMYTVAKPDDPRTTYPMPESTAQAACACGTGKNCSFVLRYLIKTDN